MENLVIVLQLIVALGIYNVWLIRPKKKTNNWRGGRAKTMKEEFAVYGFSRGFMIVIGFIKVMLATAILAGLWYPVLAFYAAAVLALLMAGAVLMHIKVQDPVQKSLPALAMLVMSAAIVFLL